MGSNKARIRKSMERIYIVKTNFSEREVTAASEDAARRLATEKFHIPKIDIISVTLKSGQPEDEFFYESYNPYWGMFYD